MATTPTPNPTPNSSSNQTLQEVNQISGLIVTLLPSILQYGIPLVEKVINMLKKDPTIPASALQQVIAQRLAETTQNDNAILGETQ